MGILSKALAAGFAGALMIGAANAATVTFNFTGTAPTDLPTGNFTTGGSCDGFAVSGGDYCSDDNAAGLTYSKGGISLTAVGFGGPVGQVSAQTLIQDIQPPISGLGVLTAGEVAADDQVQIDANEYIEFTSTGGPVTLLGIDFNRGDDVNCGAVGSDGGEGPCGTFALFVDGSMIAALAGNAVDNLVFAGITGTIFRIVATGPEGAGFAIASLTFNEVPIPGAALLLLSGLAGLGFAGRRKARA